jgi:hypothetical protein
MVNLTKVVPMSSIRSGRLLGCLVLALAMLAIPRASFAQDIRVSIGIAPPILPFYDQPRIPGDGYIWTPGYWARGWDDYYWVPGTWVLPPEVGFLWTPGYWGWGAGGYRWHEGWWGPHVGFYGGVNYGYGYNGVGYDGGYWSSGRFFYNTRVNHIDAGIIHNTYDRPVVSRGTRISYNGGRGGISARPTRQQESFTRENRVAPTGDQSRHVHDAILNPSQRYSANRGAPPVAATPRPAAFTDRDVVPARRAQPQRAQPQRAQPQRAQPQQAQPQRAQPQRAQPQQAQPQRAQPQRDQPQRAQPQRDQPQRAQPQRAQPQRDQPQRAQPQQRGQSQPRNAPRSEGKPDKRPN